MASIFDSNAKPNSSAQMADLPTESDISLPSQLDAKDASSPSRDITPVGEVQKYLKSHNVYIGADGDLRVVDAPAKDAFGIAEVGAKNAPTFQQVIDDIELQGAGFKRSILQAALRKVMREGGELRRRGLIATVVTPLSSEAEQADVRASFRRFVEVAFDGDLDVAEAVLLHFIYQVKRKLAKLPVADHMMPILVSMEQGVGKSQTVRALLEPLSELAKAVRFTDIADPRSIYVFRHPVLVLDDMECLKAQDIPTVKDRITGDEVNGRGMGSNGDVGTKQRATFIGTSNSSVVELVPDVTGHRRFFELKFRNGNPDTGGDPAISQLRAQTDFLKLWRSVDPFVPSPLEGVRAKLIGLYAAPKPKSKVHTWALELDFESEAVEGLRVQGLGFPSQRLYDLYGEQTCDARMTGTEFGVLLREASKDPNVKLGWPKRHAPGIYFPKRYS